MTHLIPYRCGPERYSGDYCLTCADRDNAMNFDIAVSAPGWAYCPAHEDDAPRQRDYDTPAMRRERIDDERMRWMKEGA